VTSPLTLRCPFCLNLNRVDLTRATDRPKCGKCRKPLLLDRPVRVERDDFEQTVLGAEAPVVVDFYADWCQPCKLLAPILDEIARAGQGRVLVAKVDADRAQDLLVRFGIRGIPTVIAFRDGEEVGRIVGFDPDGVKQLAERAASRVET
jgi:thioredoxin 2